MTSPDTSAADVVGRLRHLISLNEPKNGGPYAGFAAEACIKAMSDAITALDASRAETAAAIQDREAWRVQCEVHAAKLIWYLEQDGELQDRALKNAEHLLRPYLTTGAVFGFTPDHKWRESSTPFVVIDAVKAVFIRAETAEVALAAANARADALADLLDSNVSSLGKQLADEGRAREAAEAKLAKAVEALTALADSADSMGWSVNSGLADDAINNARRAIAEIEGKSK